MEAAITRHHKGTHIWISCGQLRITKYANHNSPHFPINHADRLSEAAIYMMESELKL
jgi:hypothetical protein